MKQTAVEFLIKEFSEILGPIDTKPMQDLLMMDAMKKAKEIEKQQKIKILRSLVYSVCLGDDVEDVEEWLKKHELNKSE